MIFSPANAVQSLEHPPPPQPSVLHCFLSGWVLFRSPRFGNRVAHQPLSYHDIFQFSHNIRTTCLISGHFSVLCAARLSAAARIVRSYLPEIPSHLQASFSLLAWVAFLRVELLVPVRLFGYPIKLLPLLSQVTISFSTTSNLLSPQSIYWGFHSIR